MLKDRKGIIAQIRSWGLKEKAVASCLLIGLLILAWVLNPNPKKLHPSGDILLKTQPPVSMAPVKEVSVLPPIPQPAHFIELPDGTKIPVKDSEIKRGGEILSLPQPLSPEVRGLAFELAEYRNEFMGFAMRIPEKWHVNATQGRILVKKESQAITGIILYPVLLKQETAASEFLKTCFGIYAQIYQRNQGHLQIDNIQSGSAQEASAQFSGVLQGIPIQGEVSAQIKGRRGDYRACWSPRPEWNHLNRTLKAIAESFETIQSQPLKLYQGDIFNIYQPKDWQVNETSNGIDVFDPEDFTQVSMALLMYVPGNPNPIQFMDYILNQIQAQNGLILQQKEYPPFKDDLGQVWKVAGREMEYDWKGRHYRAVLTSGILKQMLSFSGMISIRQAPIERWEEVAPMLEAIEKSYKIIKAEKLGGGAGSMVLPANHPADTSSIMETWESQNTSRDAAGGHWDETMRGGGYRKSEKTGEDIWVTPQDYDPARGGYINPNDPSDIIPETTS